MVIPAQRKIVLGGVVLLDWSDYTPEGEPAIDRAQEVQVVKPIRAAFDVRIPRGNVSHVLTFTRITVCTTAAAARALMASVDAALPTAAGDCTLTEPGEGGAVSTLSNAVITAYRPKTQAAWFVAEFQISGGQLS